MNYSKKSIQYHKKNKGKITIKVKTPLKNAEDLASAYTPGVGAVVKEINKSKNKSYELTNRGNMVAIVSDGTAVLGLGNMGPEAAMPVMEGKSAIFKEFANVDAIPLCINTTDTQEIIKFCKNIEPSFGGINLEDISAPRCFEILKQLEKELSIPVFHDDQDGTAIVVLSALINSCKVLKRQIKNQQVVINGAGAAGIAIAKLLLAYGIKNIIICDSKGIIYKERKDLNSEKKEIAKQTNNKNIKGELKDAMIGADVFIGVSVGNILNEKIIKTMNKNSIIFAMANPIPEIMPEKALKAGATIVGTGRSDIPNQINNALVFPGLFRGILDKKIIKITQKIKIKVSIALANMVKNPNKSKILPEVIDKRVAVEIKKVIL